MGVKRQNKRVDLEKLFRWNKPLSVKDHRGEEAGVVYLRILNDFDNEKARLFAIRKSRDMRRLMRNKETDEYAALMEGMENYNKDQRISVILLTKFSDFLRRARDEARTSMPNTPRDDSMEKNENYEEAVDTFEERFGKEVNSIIEKLSEAERARLSELPDEELSKMVESALIDQVCQNVAATAIGEYQAFLATYEDPEYTTRYFDSFEEFSNLAAEVKEQLLRGYRELTILPEEIKN